MIVVLKKNLLEEKIEMEKAMMEMEFNNLLENGQGLSMIIDRDEPEAEDIGESLID